MPECDDARAQRATEEFTAAVWRAAGIGRMTMMEIISRFFEDQAVIRSVESRGGVRFRAIHIAEPTPAEQLEKLGLSERLKEAEDAHILAAIDEAGGNISKAAVILGVKRTTLQSKLRRHQDMHEGEWVRPSQSPSENLLGEKEAAVKKAAAAAAL